MKAAAEAWPRRLQLTVAMYSLLWLLAANLVGLWLAALLIWPEWGQALGPFSYGRWMPLHMDWQLYGWCSLPLVGLLMSYFLQDTDGGDAHFGLIAWSLALGMGGVLSLHGDVSGKLFLNWSGLGRIAFPVAQLVLWAILLRASLGRWLRGRRLDLKQWLQAGLLLLLLASPLSLFWTSGAEVYPPIDPESGGATGHSLLASSLGILFIFGCLPFFLRLERTRAVLRGLWLFGGFYLASILGWLGLDHGNASNTQWGQIAGLGILLIWVPILVFYFRTFRWPAALRHWLGAFFFWWGFLTLSGFLSFLPGILDLMKFTNGMVAHAHLAMAGMLGAFNMLILGSLGRAQRGDPWVERRGFWLWQGGTLLYVVAMLIQGVREGLDPTVLFGGNALTSFFYGLRLFAGLLLLSANLSWLCLLERVRRSAHESRRPVADCVKASTVVESPISLPDYGVPLNKVSEV